MKGKVASVIVIKPSKPRSWTGRLIGWALSKAGGI
jgi:hypothetical protein